MEMTIDKAIDSVRQIAANPFSNTRVIDEIAVGQFIRQGDVYLTRIAKTNESWKHTRERQVALGNTMGARHTVDDAVGVRHNPEAGKVERLAGGKFRCLGPQIEAETRFTLSHPEHADFSCPPGNYQVSYQVDAQTLRRVQD